jgi:hypothetical protein
MHLQLQGLAPVLLIAQILDCIGALEHVYPFFFWAVVGVWTKMTGQLEGPSLEAFLNACSSKLVRWATLLEIPILLRNKAL